jgi:hypothetical protein
MASRLQSRGGLAMPLSGEAKLFPPATRSGLGPTLKRLSHPERRALLLTEGTFL